MRRDRNVAFALVRAGRSVARARRGHSASGSLASARECRWSSGTVFSAPMPEGAQKGSPAEGGQALVLGLPGSVDGAGEGPLGSHGCERDRGDPRTAPPSFEAMGRASDRLEEGQSSDRHPVVQSAGTGTRGRMMSASSPSCVDPGTGCRPRTPSVRLASR